VSGVESGVECGAPRLARPADLGRGFERLRLATPQGLGTLRASIHREGIRTPLLCAEIDARVEVVDGFKRLRIATELGLETIPVLQLLGLSRPRARASVLLCNARVRGPTLLEEALVIRSLAEDDGLSLSEIGALLGRDKSFCSRRLRMARGLEPALLPAVRDGSLSVSVAALLTALPRGNQVRLAEAIVREGLSKRETEWLLQAYAQAGSRTASEILLAHPREALGRARGRGGDGERAPGESVAGRAVVEDLLRATELLARAGRRVPPAAARRLPAGLASALDALRAQLAALEARLAEAAPATAPAAAAVAVP
jgi:ParB-like chromosome segregation protein Spo0J